MAAYTELTREQARAAGDVFGLEVADVASVPAGSVNSNYRLTLADGTPVFARIYEEQDRNGAEGEARLLDHLANHGVATPRPLPRKDGVGFTFVLQLGHAAGTRPMALFPWRLGDMVCQAGVSPAIAGEV